MRTTVLCAALLILSSFAYCADNNDTAIMVWDAFDSGLLPARVSDWPAANRSNTLNADASPLYKIEKDKVIFDMSENDAKKIYHTHCLIKSSAKSVLLEFKVCAKRVKAYKTQGLYVSPDGDKYKAVPYTVIDDSTFQVNAELVNGQLFIATDLPHGRNLYEKLLIETSGKGNWKMFSKDNRSLAIFELGTDDGKKPIYYLWAGEDACETSGMWLADYMIRVLYENPELAKRLTDKAVLRICPTMSPYSLNAKSGGYTDMQGKSRYGAAGWSKTPITYPELQIMTDMIEKTVAEKRLGFVLSIHGWYAASPDSEIEAIKTAGNNTLSQERAEWAVATMNSVMNGVKHKSVKLADKCWAAGLFREHALSKYNAITFRIEVSTFEQDYNSYRTMAQTMLTNLAEINDWTPVLDANWTPVLDSGNEK